MCKNLVEKGSLDKPLLLFNRTTSKAEDLSKKLGNSAVESTVNDLVDKSDIIFYCLGNDQSVLDQIDTILQTDVKNKIFVDCSTISPDSTKIENERITKAGGIFVAMPVFGAPTMAEAGQLVCVIAGPTDATEKVKKYCKGVMCRAEIDLSDQEPSKATLLKIIGNTFIVSMVTTLSEGYVAAEKTGLGVQQLLKFVETMFAGPFSAYSDRMLSGDYYQREEPLLAVNFARKDAGHAMEVASDYGTSFHNMELADSYLQQVKDYMGEHGDLAGIYGAKRQEAGLDFENKGH